MNRFPFTRNFSNLQVNTDSWLGRIETVGKLYLTPQTGNVKIVFFIGQIRIVYGQLKFFKISTGYTFWEMKSRNVVIK